MFILNKINSELNNLKYLLNIYNKEIKREENKINMINKYINNKYNYINEFHSNILENYEINCILRKNIQNNITKLKDLIFFMNNVNFPIEIKEKILTYTKLPKNKYKCFNKINKRIKILRLNGLRNN